ncbi:MAG: cupin domain-containing protein [Pseudomonadota bacterium]|nr:cupin domain-containing protein [Pseudomonadota bacterium]
MPKVDLEQIAQLNLTGYPAPFDQPLAGRWYRRLSPPSGLTDFGASHVLLKPGAWSSQRHWHEGEDELVIMLSGEAVLIEDGGETVMRPGDIASFAKGVRNGHQLINRSASDCVFVAIGGGTNSGGTYSDIDMMFTPDDRYVRKDGSAY